MKLATTLTAAVIALLAAGCSTSEGGKSDVTVESLVAELGCSDTYTTNDGEMFVSEGGTCTIGDATIWIRDFGTKESQANWWEGAKEFGITEEDGVTVGLIFVDPDREILDQVRATLVDGSPAPTAPPSPTPSPAGRAAFLDAVASITRWDSELEDELAEMGEDLCAAWGRGVSIENTDAVLADSGLADEADTITDAAIMAFCPEYARS